MYVYILQSLSNKRYYIGSSKNPKNRLCEHNTNKTLSTRNRGPWELRFAQKFESKQQALYIERKLKKFKSRKIIEKIIEDGSIKMQFGA